MAAARSTKFISFAAAVTALFAFNFASLKRPLTFSIARRCMSNVHSALVIPGGRSLTTGARAAFFFAGADLAARTSGADVRGATYCLVFMAGWQSKAMACAGVKWRELAEGEGERGGMAPIMVGKVMILGETSPVSPIELTRDCF
jgi:hypothetical protein